MSNGIDYTQILYRVLTGDEGPVPEDWWYHHFCWQSVTGPSCPKCGTPREAALADQPAAAVEAACKIIEASDIQSEAMKIRGSHNLRAWKFVKQLRNEIIAVMLDRVPQIYATYNEEDDSLLVEWMFPNQQLGFSIEPDGEHSWFWATKDSKGGGSGLLDDPDLNIRTLIKAVLEQNE